MMKCLMIFICLFYGIKSSCIEVYPSQIDVKSDSLNRADKKICGESISLIYSQSMINEIDIEIIGETENGACRLQKHFYMTKNQPLNVSIDRNSCMVNFVYVNKTLTISSLSKNTKKICIKKISAQICFEKDVHTLRRRSSAMQTTQHRHSHSSSNMEGILFTVILSCGLFLVLVTTLVVSVLSCCYNNNSKYSTDIETGKLTDDSYNSTYSSGSMTRPDYSISPSTVDCLHQTLPQDIHLKASSPYHSEYLSPSHLNIPSTTPPQKNKIELSTENMTDWSSDTTRGEQIYHVLEAPQEESKGMERLTEPLLVQTQGERAYFVLEITSESPPQDSHIIPDTSSEKIYHVLDPALSSMNTDKLCSLCSNALPQEESMYLVILPDQQDTLETTEEVMFASEPIYHTLEQPSVICQSCLCAEGGDPIYHELEGSHDPVYDRVKNLIRQGTSTSDGIYSTVKRQDTANSDGSHIYSRVHSLDIPHESQLTHGDGSLLSVKRVPLGMTHAESSDYASIPDDTVYDDDIQKQQHQRNLTLLVNSLKSKLTNRLKMVKQDKVITEEDISTGDIDTNHIKLETISNPSQINHKKDRKKRRPISSPAHTAAVRILSNTSNTPIIIAQRKRSGSYHILNIEDIWQYQLANRYAPLSVMRRRTPSPVKTRKVTSMMSRKSYIRDYLKEESASIEDSSYEVPIPMHFEPLGGVIPPPSVLKRNLSRQDALGLEDTVELYEEEIENPSGIRIYSVKSEPCLDTSNSVNDDYDFLEPLSPITTPSSPLKSPLKKSVSSTCPQSPSKRLYIERYVPSTQLYFYDAEDYDHIWDYEEEEKTEEGKNFK